MSGPYSYVPMPIDKDGNGPADGDDVYRVIHEVWDGNCATVCECHDEAMARWVADQLNSASVPAAYELAAQWHDKNYRGCMTIAKDEPRIAVDIRGRARQAAVHHSASAAGLRLAATEQRRRIYVSI